MIKKLFLTGAVSLLAVGCQPPATNVVSNVNTNANGAVNTGAANNNAAIANMGSAPPSGSAMVETSEPNTYQAKLTTKFEAVGDSRSTALPPITATVARDGAKRRTEFTLPGGEKIVYLDDTDKHQLILPNRKQYANINEKSIGFDIKKMMTPAQIVEQVKNLKGVERVGEETVNGRTVVKYKFAGMTDTKSKAGNVATESFILVDKETNLPLHSETIAESQNSNVQGYQGLRIITDMSDVKTEVAPDAFSVPADFKEVDEAQIRGQVNLLFSTLTTVIGQIMQSAQPNQPAANK